MKELTFGEKLVKGLVAMANNDGPYLVHCVEGKDRTGYLIMVLSALSGATYEEMVDDYMLTYDNYYSITKKSDKDRYETIKEKDIDLMLHYLIGDEDNKKNLIKIDDYAKYARKYLISIGMQEIDIDNLVAKLSN